MKKKLTRHEFSWQVGYAAYAVNQSTADRVYDYIKNQKAHHRRKSAEKEYNQFLKIYGIKVPDSINPTT
jgi:putative transposase